jgi:hypothetical protein
MVKEISVRLERQPYRDALSVLQDSPSICDR